MTDVAVRAGVSMKTVSNVVNEFPHVSESTRSRVLAAIEEMGYQPNLSARNLARGRAGMIALVVPQLDMPYFAALSMQVLEAAAAHGWVVLIQQTKGDLAAEQAALRGHFGQRIDGLILSPSRVGATDLRSRPEPGPLVLLGEHSRDVADHVAIDNVDAARTAVGHLLDIGRSRIAMVGASPRGRANPRLVGYRAALADHGVAVRDEMVLPVPGNRGDDGEAAMSAFLDSGPRTMPDAVFCITDWVALGVIRALQVRGLRVPDDVAVVGFDDIPYGRTAAPTLTTISPDRSQIARLAVESLLAQHDAARTHAQYAPREISADFTLVIRESTAGPGPARPSLTAPSGGS